jgi:hypothetical protein
MECPLDKERIIFVVFDQEDDSVFRAISHLFAQARSIVHRLWYKLILPPLLSQAVLWPNITADSLRAHGRRSS